MVTDSYFMGLLIWLKKWERDERSSRCTEFFYVFQGRRKEHQPPCFGILERFRHFSWRVPVPAGVPFPQERNSRGGASEEKGERGNHTAVAAPAPHPARRG